MPTELEAEATEELEEVEVAIEPVDARDVRRRPSPEGADLVRVLLRENGAATVWSSLVERDLPRPVASAAPRSELCPRVE